MPDKLKGKLLICQSGGPTAVFNSSLSGVIEEAFRHEEITGVYGAVNGVLGILRHSIIDLSKESPAVIAGLRAAPSAALGASRYKVGPEDLERMQSVFGRLGIRYFLMNGGNGSMATAHLIWHFATQQNYELRVIGIPKTFDNDLLHTDHCPGYPSIARWIAIATPHSGRDTEGISTADPVKILECMGRNVGWVAAASALNKKCQADAPHLIYFPEIAFRTETFLHDVQNVYDSLGYAVIVVVEMLRGEDGRLLVESPRELDKDSFGSPLGGEIGQHLATLVAENLKVKARCDKPGTMQRSWALEASPVDLAEAYLVGRRAVRYAVMGKSGFMVTLERAGTRDYRAQTGIVELAQVANRVRTLPREFINEAGNFISPQFQEYAAPLVGGGMPTYVRLERHFLKIEL